MTDILRDEEQKQRDADKLFLSTQSDHYDHGFLALECLQEKVDFTVRRDGHSALEMAVRNKAYDSALLIITGLVKALRHDPELLLKELEYTSERTANPKADTPEMLVRAQNQESIAEEKLVRAQGNKNLADEILARAKTQESLASRLNYDIEHYVKPRIKTRQQPPKGIPVGSTIIVKGERRDRGKN